ncbi:MAG: TIGR02452 family protein [Blautia sp.]|nr:TIGR02452 family protein [Blautia sp.]
MDRKELNCRVFFDTEDWIKQTEKLRRAVRKSQEGSVLYPADAALEVPERKPERPTRISVTSERSFACALRVGREQPDAGIGVLNFASAKHPGGGVRTGSSAQEESLCRCSTLYPVLNSEKLLSGFYRFHRANKSNLYTSAVIYSPDIIICKTDTPAPERMEEPLWQKVDILTCAAPNMSTYRRNAMEESAMTIPSEEELFDIHKERARRILTVAALHHIDILVSGAFGCGAFGNDPEIVSRAWKDVLSEMDGILPEVIFAIYGRKGADKNLEAFADTFAKQSESE